MIQKQEKTWHDKSRRCSSTVQRRIFLFPGSRVQLCRHLGLDTDTAYRISCGFGAGIARTGNICGAVAGAVMVIGLKYGKTAVGDDAAKERTYALVQEFITAFRAKNGSINCTELLGYDLRDPEQRTSAHAKGAVAMKCPGFTRDAVEILEKMI